MVLGHVGLLAIGAIIALMLVIAASCEGCGPSTRSFSSLAVIDSCRYLY